MGYRSTMILGIAPKYKKEFEKTLKKHYEKEKIFELVKEEDDMLIYEAEYLKWYNDFDDVKDIEELLNKAHTKDEYNSFLLGIGEDGVIHSELGHHYDYVGTFTTHEIY